MNLKEINKKTNDDTKSDKELNNKIVETNLQINKDFVGYKKVFYSNNKSIWSPYNVIYAG